MTQEDYSSYELEANASPHITHSTHHVHIPREYNARRLLEVVNREAMDQLEPGQNMGAFGLMSWRVPVNTNK